MKLSLEVKVFPMVDSEACFTEEDKFIDFITKHVRYCEAHGCDSFFCERFKEGLNIRYFKYEDGCTDCGRVALIRPVYEAEGSQEKINQVEKTIVELLNNLNMEGLN